MSGEALGALAGASPLRATGRNIEIWLPHEARTGERSRAWMKLQNEVQMAWFEHPLNVEREARGLPAINSIWLHGQGALRPVTSPFARVMSDAAATRGLALASGVKPSMPPESFASLANDGTPRRDARRTRSVFRAVHRAGLGALERVAEGARSRVVRARAASARRRLARQLGLTLCGDTGSVTLSVTRADLRKFWRRRPIAALFIE